MSTDSSSESNVNIGSIAGGTIGALFAVLIIALVLYCVHWKQRKFSPVQSNQDHAHEADLIPDLPPAVINNGHNLI